MNTEQTIKALEYCANDECVGVICPYYAISCENHMPKDALALIKEQQAEIEKLKKQLDDKCDRCIARDRADTVNKMQERFENSFDKLEEFYNETDHENMVYSNKVLELIDQIAKEILEEAK